MAKWFDETVLIKYWEDRCDQYRLSDGRRIRSARRNGSFGRYPDITENYLSDNDVVPCEIEWVTTAFDQHCHDISILRDSRGFLVVFRNDAGFPLEQVEIDEQDFRAWYTAHAQELCQETLAEIAAISARSQEPQIYLFHIPIRGNANFRIGMENGVWGFPANEAGVTRGWAKISQIKRHDIVVFVRNWHAGAGVQVRGGRVSAAQYIGAFDEIVGVVVTRGLHTLQRPRRLWPDGDYPHRFHFRREPLFVGRNVPCNPRDLGRSLHEILRCLQVNGSVERIDTSLIVKLMSLCTE